MGGGGGEVAGGPCVLPAGQAGRPAACLAGLLPASHSVGEEEQTEQQHQQQDTRLHKVS